MTDREYALKNAGVYVAKNDLILRIPNDYDLDALCILEAEQDPSLQTQLDDDVEERRKFKRILYNNDFGENFHLAIIDAQKEEFMGELNIQSYKSNAPEIGISLLQSHQRKGIAVEAIKLYMEMRTEISEVIYFTARIKTTNINSQKMISKLNSEKVMQIGNVYCYKIFLE